MEKEEKYEEEDGVDEESKKNRKGKKQLWPVEGYSDDENMWQLLGNLLN